MNTNNKMLITTNNNNNQTSSHSSTTTTPNYNNKMENILVKATCNNNKSSKSDLCFKKGDYIYIDTVIDSKCHGFLFNEGKLTQNGGWFDMNLVTTTINPNLNNNDNFGEKDELGFSEFNFNNDLPQVNNDLNFDYKLLENNNEKDNVELTINIKPELKSYLKEILKTNETLYWGSKLIELSIFTSETIETEYFYNVLTDETTTTKPNHTTNNNESKETIISLSTIKNLTIEQLRELEKELNVEYCSNISSNIEKLMDKINLQKQKFLKQDNNRLLNLGLLNISIDRLFTYLILNKLVNTKEKPVVVALYLEIVKDLARLILYVRMEYYIWKHPQISNEIHHNLDQICINITCFVNQSEQTTEDSTNNEIIAADVNKNETHHLLRHHLRFQIPNIWHKTHELFNKLKSTIKSMRQIANSTKLNLTEIELITKGNRILSEANSMIEHSGNFIDTLKQAQSATAGSLVGQTAKRYINDLARSICNLVIFMQDSNGKDINGYKYMYSFELTDKMNAFLNEIELNLDSSFVISKFLFDFIDDSQCLKFIDVYDTFLEHLDKFKADLNIKDVDVFSFYEQCEFLFVDSFNDFGIPMKTDSLNESVSSSNRSSSYTINQPEKSYYRSMSSPIVYNKNLNKKTSETRLKNLPMLNTAKFNFDRRPTNADRGNIKNTMQQDLPRKATSARQRKMSDAWYLESDFGPDQIIFNPNNTVKAATLPALIERLTFHDSNDSTFVQTFLLTYQSFTTTKEIIDLLIKRYHIEPYPGLNEEQLKNWREYKQKPVRLRVCNVIKNWIENYLQLETEGSSYKEYLDKIEQFSIDISEEMKLPSELILKAIQKKRNNVEKKIEDSAHLAEPPQPILPKNLSKFKLLDINPLEVARHLCMMEFEMYRQIRPDDLLNKAWSQKSQEKGKNVKAMIFWANRLTNWVAHVLLSATETKKRCSYIKHFITIAEKCLELNNFSSLVAILAAFSVGAILRLKRTWDLMHGKWMVALDKLKTITSTSMNYSAYRELLHCVNPPCVPFLGMYLKDVTFNADGNSDLINNTELINFSKQSKTASIIREIQQYQFLPYNFKKIEQIHDFLKLGIQNAPILNELYAISEKLEPKEREDEKLARLLQESGFL